MKVGDVVFSTKIRPYIPATIIKADVTVKNHKDKRQVRSSYEASYGDGSFLKFYGFDIGKTIFKDYDEHENNHQMTLEEFGMVLN